MNLFNLSTLQKQGFFLLLISFFILPIHPQSSQQLEKQFDALLTELFAEEGPGGTALVSQNGQIIYHKAFGKANIELDVPMKVDHIFRIGSVTKQFTTVAILQLMEQGKLSLQDDITKFIPDYPTHGHTITVEHLLTHTSGIKSYTGMEKFWEKQTIDMEPKDLIDFFKNEPMDFAPGEKWMYNNSAFFILGYIIEELSGMSYSDYVEENLFKPLGMKNSYYGNNDLLIMNRAAGYSKNEGKVVNSDYLSMKLPYAAGSLRSTVEDLLIWNKAIFGYKVVSKESLEKAWTSFKLNSGEPTGYGYGWSISNVQGSPSIEHGGGINGFLSHAMYMPEDEVFVAVLSNCNCAAPGEVAAKMAAHTVGKPYEWKEMSVEADALKEYEGVYESEFWGDRNIRITDGKLYSRRGKDSKYHFIPFEKDKFFVEDPITTLEFKRDDNGKIKKVVSVSRNQIIPWMKTDKALAPIETVDINKLDLDKYNGKFELAPEFIIHIFNEDGKVFAQATNQPKIEIEPDTEWLFEAKGVKASIEFVPDEAGKVKSIVLHQGGNSMPAKRIE